MFSNGVKATGIVRRVDDLGRIVIPKEIRKVRGLEVNSLVEIFVQGNDVVLSKYQLLESIQQNIVDNWLESLHETTDCNVSIHDGHSEIANAGYRFETPLELVKNTMASKEPTQQNEFFAQPIVSEGAAIGVVILHNTKGKFDKKHLSMLHLVAISIAKTVPSV